MLLWTKTTTKQHNFKLKFHYTVGCLNSTYLVDIRSRCWPPLGQELLRCCLGGKTGRGRSWTRSPAAIGACWVVRYTPKFRSQLRRKVQLVVAHWDRRCGTSWAQDAVRWAWPWGSQGQGKWPSPRCLRSQEEEKSFFFWKADFFCRGRCYRCEWATSARRREILNWPAWSQGERHSYIFCAEG